MMNAKRKQDSSSQGTKRYKKQEPSKESFLADIKRLGLYTETDQYYRKVKPETGPLILDWR